jgi:hypothetical protein
MSEISMEQGTPRTQRRVVEAELKLPKLEEIRLPKIQVNLEPARAMAEQVVLTGLGAGVLLARGVMAAIKAANAAGVEAAQHPGPLTRVLLGWVRPADKTPAEGQAIKIRVPVMPIAHYDALSAEDILERLADLAPEQLQVVRDYEAQHAARPAILEAIAARLAGK